MKIQGAARWLSWCLIFLLTACSDGSGRQGTDLVVSGSGPLEPGIGMCEPGGSGALYAPPYCGCCCACGCWRC